MIPMTVDDYHCEYEGGLYMTCCDSTTGQIERESVDLVIFSMENDKGGLRFLCPQSQYAINEKTFSCRAGVGNLVETLYN